MLFRSRILKILAAIIFVVALMYGLAAFSEHKNFQSQSEELQNLADAAVLAGVRAVSTTTRNKEIEGVSIAAIRENNPRNLKFDLSSQLDKKEYTVELMSKYEPKFFAFLGRGPNTIKATSTVPIFNKPAAKIIVAVDLGAEHSAFITNNLNDKIAAKALLGRHWRYEFDMVNGGVAEVVNFISRQSTLSGYALLLVTNDISDPELCSGIKASRLDTDVIYFGSPSPAVEAFYDECIKPHPQHACMADRPHYVSDKPRMAVMVSEFIRNYGIMRISC